MTSMAASPQIPAQIARQKSSCVHRHDDASNNAALQLSLSASGQFHPSDKPDEPLMHIDLEACAEQAGDNDRLRQQRHDFVVDHQTFLQFIITVDGTCIARCPKTGRTASGASRTEAAAELARAPA